LHHLWSSRGCLPDMLKQQSIQHTRPNTDMWQSTNHMAAMFSLNCLGTMFGGCGVTHKYGKNQHESQYIHKWGHMLDSKKSPMHGPWSSHRRSLDLGVGCLVWKRALLSGMCIHPIPISKYSLALPTELCFLVLLSMHRMRTIKITSPRLCFAQK